LQAKLTVSNAKVGYLACGAGGFAPKRQPEAFAPGSGYGV